MMLFKKNAIKIPLETAENMFKCIPRIIEAVCIEGRRWYNTILVREIVQSL
jgi:hypothetical protein